MDRKVWPVELPTNCGLSTLAKNVYIKFKRTKTNCWFLMDIDPIAVCNEKVSMGLLIYPNKGIITFSMHDNTPSEVFKYAIDTYIQMVEDKVYKLLLESAVLIFKNGDKKLLKFPYKHIVVLEETNNVDHSRCYTQDCFSSTMSIDALFSGDSNLPYPSNSEEIDEAEAIAILTKLAPEYTVLKASKKTSEIEEVRDSEINVENLPPITGKEVDYETFLLDDTQVKYINEMGTGHRVLLANAGAGKSVLLLSKGYRYACSHKNGRVLITCFNNNLADAYKFKNACANGSEHKNLYLMTFHKLVKKIYKDCLNISIMGLYPTEQEIQDLLLYIKRGKVSLRFAAIFIDEVQIFQPLYLDICYSLLDSNEDRLFLMAGDLNQTVRSQSRKGDAPWKKINDGKLNFQGRVKYISHNYRNSLQISKYLNGMLLYMNKKLSENNLINLDEFEYNIFGEGPSKSIALKIKKGISRYEICKHTVDAVIEITTKYKIGYSDIAILFPYKENKLFRYYLLYWITEEFKKRGIEYSLIIDSSAAQTKAQFSKTNGVVLSTIDSSLGLDFKAVILTGLYPYEYVYTDESSRKTKKINCWNQLSKLAQSEQESVKVQLRKIFTACSRAREVLYVLSDIEPGNPFEDVLGDRSK